MDINDIQQWVNKAETFTQQCVKAWESFEDHNPDKFVQEAKGRSDEHRYLMQAHLQLNKEVVELSTRDTFQGTANQTFAALRTWLSDFARPEGDKEHISDEEIQAMDESDRIKDNVIKLKGAEIESIEKRMNEIENVKKPQ